MYACVCRSRNVARNGMWECIYVYIYNIYVYMYVYIVCTCEKENRAMPAHSACVYVCVYLYVFMLAIWHHFLSQFLPSGVRSASYRSAISFKWTLLSLSLEGNLIPLFLHLSFPEICTSHESEERVRIIPRENRTIRDLHSSCETFA